MNVCRNPSTHHSSDGEENGSGVAAIFDTPPEEFSAPVHVNFKCIALIVPYYKGALITSSELFFIFHIRKRFC